MHATHIELLPGVHAFYEGDLAVLLLESQHCFFVRLDRRIQRREWGELKFELESHVPLDAESMSSIVLDAEPTAALVCDAEKVASSVATSTELEGVKVLAVIPLALFVAERAIQKRGAQTILVVGDEWIDRFEVDAGRIAAWTWHSTNELQELLYAHMPTIEEANRQTSSREIVVVEASANAGVLLNKSTPVQRIVEYDDQILMAMVNRILSGYRDPQYSFEDGPLDYVDCNAPARGAQLFAAWTVAVSFCFVVGSIFFSSHAYRSETRQVIARQRHVFERIFPGQRQPVGLLSRFESERRRLIATRDDSSVPTVGSALPVLQALLSGLDVEARFTTSALHVVPNQLVRFDCIAKSFSDLEQLELSLAGSGFEMPRSAAKQTSRGVTPSWSAIKWSREDVERIESIVENTDAK